MKYIDCHDCKYVKEKRDSPDICKSEDAMRYYNPKSKILFCSDINQNHDCKFVELKLVASVREFFNDNN